MAGMRMKSYAIIAKPIGPICNLNCGYCYYRNKKSLFPETKSFRMTTGILKAFIKQYIEAQDTPEIQFVWQGGEPTLMGKDFFRKAIKLQNQYSAGKKISNAIQSNGILLDDEWCAFLASNQFLVGVSVDGPERFHDHYRKDVNNNPTFKKVIQSVERLKYHGVSFNTVTVLNNMNIQYPREVYRFLKDFGEGFIQFIPAIEPIGKSIKNNMGSVSEFPLKPTLKNAAAGLSRSSITPGQFADFYIQIFNEWIKKDIGDYFVQFFDVALNNWMGMPSPLCTFSKSCENSGVLEHNGDIYTCDHYVYPEYKLGNIMDSDLAQIMEIQKDIRPGKSETLPGCCQKCEYLFACNGGCPKHRIIESPDGKPGLNYFCQAYKKIFRHMSPYMDLMKKLLQSGRPAYLIKDYINKHP